MIEWGDGIWGAEAAARTYFGVPASALSREQAALLAGAIINPRVYSPGASARRGCCAGSRSSWRACRATSRRRRCPPAVPVVEPEHVPMTSLQAPAEEPASPTVDRESDEAESPRTSRRPRRRRPIRQREQLRARTAKVSRRTMPRS